MFGMPSIEFWEADPQLYWAYRFSYEKKIEFEQKELLERMKLESWLQGKANEVSFSVALNNAFNKKKREYPSYENFFKKEEKPNKVKDDLAKLLEGVTDKDERGAIEFNYWARL